MGGGLGVSGGNTYAVTATIANTLDPTLYQSEHYSTGNLTCAYTVPAGSYTVKVKTAELYWTSAGQRVFDIQINGTTVASNVDVYALAGGINRALDLSYPVTVSGTQVSITLVQKTGYPAINGIEITQGSSTFTPIQVNLGGPAYGQWAGDSGCQGGSTYAVTATIANTLDPTLYQSEHYSTREPDVRVHGTGRQLHGKGEDGGIVLDERRTTGVRHPDQRGDGGE